MIQIRVLAQYWGANPVRPWPVVVLEIEGENEQLLKIFEKKSQQRIREALRGLKRNYKFINCFRQVDASKPELTNTNVEDLENTKQAGSELDSNEVSTNSDWVKAWLLNWIEALQERAGMLCLVKPQCSQMGIAKGNGPNTMHLAVIVDMAHGSLQDLIEGLKWSRALWQWSIGDGQANLGRKLIAAAPPLRNAPKPSFRAMAKAAVGLEMDWHYESLIFEIPMLVIGRGTGLRRVSQKATDQTSGWGMQISKNKITTTLLLAGAGYPVAAGAAVNSLHEAIAIADKLGYPVVTKPAAEDQAKGVITGIQDKEQLLKAFRRSEAAGTPVLVQQHIAGKDFRFYIVNGKLLAALERIPPVVIGDGKTCIHDLITAVNLERGKKSINTEGEEKIHLNPIVISAETKFLLQAQQMSLESVPADGRTITLHPTANFSVGGTVRECLQEVHPDNKRLIEKVSQICRLDIAGVDVIASAIDIPLLQSGGVICEVNGLPGVLPHQLAEPERHLMAESLSLLIEGRPQPPLVAVLGGASTTSVIAELEKELSSYFEELAVIDRHGWRQGGMIWSEEDSRHFSNQRRGLRDVEADAFILEIDTRSLMAHGLPWTKTDILLLLSDGPAIVAPWLQLLKKNSHLTITSPSGSQSVAAQVVEQFQKQGILRRAKN